MTDNQDHIRLSFFHFKDRRSRWWAFKQMQEAHPSLVKLEGLKFYKLLGSGAGEGFSLKPDFSTYALLQVWESKEAMLKAEGESWLKETYKQSDGQYHFILAPYMTKGTWSGQRPFETVNSVETPLMAVITRARIKPSKLISFWLSVPSVSKVIKKQKALLFQKGLGEWPLIEQATFSIWNREAAMKTFAYKDEAHRKVVQKTRRLDWYSEEQFTRFMVMEQQGNWPNQQFDKLQS